MVLGDIRRDVDNIIERARIGGFASSTALSMRGSWIPMAARQN